MRVKVDKLKLKWSDFSLQVNNWQVESGARVLLEGPSGCGKTSFLHAIAGLIPPNEGTIWLAEQNISQMDEEQRAALRRKQCGLVFQKIHLLPHLNLWENLSLTAPADAGDAVEHWLHYFRLWDRRSHLPQQMSQGETQRAAVARALLSSPALVLADEPTSSLDDRNTELVLRSLLDLPKQTTVIVVSHDQRLRPGFSKRLDFAKEVAR